MVKPYKFKDGSVLRIKHDDDGYYLSRDFPDGTSLYGRHRSKNIQDVEEKRDDLWGEEEYYRKQDEQKETMPYGSSSADKKTFEKYVRERFSSWKIKSIKTIQPARTTFPGKYEAILIKR